MMRPIECGTPCDVTGTGRTDTAGFSPNCAHWTSVDHPGWTVCADSLASDPSPVIWIGSSPRVDHFTFTEEASPVPAPRNSRIRLTYEKQGVGRFAARLLHALFPVAR